MCSSTVQSLLSETLEIKAQRKKMKAFFLHQLQCHIRESEKNAFKVQGVSRESDSNMRLTAVMSTLILHTHTPQRDPLKASFLLLPSPSCLCECVCVTHKMREIRK